jgi:hypothetical protein
VQTPNIPRQIKWKYIVPIISALILASGGIIAAVVTNKGQQIIITPTSPINPISTKQPSTSISSSSKFNTQLTVVGTAQNGVPFTALASGTFLITIVDGAYCTYPGPHCKTELRIYKNKSVKWGILPGDKNLEPVNFDARVGDGAEREEAQALAVGKSMSTTIDLQNGDQLLFIPADIKNMYSDNSGQVVLNIVLA